MTAQHDPTVPCEMYCTEPIGPDGTPANPHTIAFCPDCDRLLRFLAREVLPAVRKWGYYSPPGTDVNDEFRAMTEQLDWRPQLKATMRDALGPILADQLFGGPHTSDPDDTWSGS